MTDEEALRWHKEWRTIGNHRVLISVRHGAPQEGHYELLSVAEMALRPYPNARMVGLFDDDKACVETIYVGTTSEEEFKELKEFDLGFVLGSIFMGTVVMEAFLVPEGDRNSNHYSHMGHIWRCLEGKVHL